MKYALVKGVSVAALAAAISACGGGGSDSDSTGTLSLGLTDAAVDSVQEVNITVTGVELQPADGERISFAVDNPENLENINLLSLQNGAVEALLAGQELPAGDYEWIRLKLGDASTFSVIDDNGGTNGLFIPSGASRGLQTSGFTVPAGGTASFTIDFDVRKSLLEPSGLGGDYLLKPILRLVDNTQVGKISGSIDPTLLANACSAAGSNTSVYAGAVYVHAGHEVTPDDLGSANEPVVAVPVDTSTYEYQASFIEAGNYTVSYTCELDQREDANGEMLDENLTFIPAEGIEVVVTADQVTELVIN